MIKKVAFLLIYRNARLSFGIRCSPFLLMISLYYILALESESDPAALKDLKHFLYCLLYMDNGAVTVKSLEEFNGVYEQLSSVFSPYQFEVQQLKYNDLNLQEKNNHDYGESPGVYVKLFGLMWDRSKDVSFTNPLTPNLEADTKQTILKSIASQFDICNYNLPVLNHSRLFMNSLQCDKTLKWDDILPPDLKRQWRDVCWQANLTPTIDILEQGMVYIGFMLSLMQVIPFTAL